MRQENGNAAGEKVSEQEHFGAHLTANTHRWSETVTSLAIAFEHPADSNKKLVSSRRGKTATGQ